MFAGSVSIVQAGLMPLVEVGLKAIVQPPEIKTEPFSIITYGGNRNWALATLDYARIKDPLNFIKRYTEKKELSDEYYDITYLGFAHKPKVCVITNTDIIKSFLLKTLRFDEEKLSGGSDFEKLSAAIGRFSPLTIRSVNIHTCLRTSFKQHLHGFGKIHKLTTKIAQATKQFITETFKGAEVGVYNMTPLMMHYTVQQTLTHLVEPRKKIDIPALASLIDRVERYVTAEILWSKGSFNPLKKKCIAELNLIAETLIKKSDGFIQEIKTEVEEDWKMSLEDQKEWVMSAAKTVLAIGSGTTRSALVSSLLCLMKNPAAQAALYEAVKEIDLDDVKPKRLDKTLKYCLPLQYFIHELLRLYPPISMLSRETTDFDIEKVKFELPVGDKEISFEPNTVIYLDYFHAHRDKTRWENPLQFDPSRFEREPGRMKEVQAFSQGPSTCLGKPFAQALLNIMICALVQRFEISEPVDEEGNPLVQEYEAVGSMTTRLNKELEVLLTPRH